MSRITTPFGFTSTTTDVTRGVDLADKRVIVTGGASGIGIETSRAFAGLGAEVTLAVRNTEAGHTITNHISSVNGTPVHVEHLDLADQDSGRTFSSNWNGPLSKKWPR